MTLTLDAARLGSLKAGPSAVTAEARWLMAYAAALGESDARYYDTTAPAGPVAHPLFAVCYEWPLAQTLRAKGMDEEVARRGVHAFHALTIHRPPQAGERLRVSAKVIGVQKVRAGTLVVTRFSATDSTGVAVTTTEYGSIYRGVDLEGDEIAAAPSIPAASSVSDGVRWEERVEIAPQTAHVYTECARIYNPIHTDAAVARAAGLPAIILHGTATLALAVSRVVARELGGDPGRVRGVAVRFSGMVRLPSHITVRGRDAEAGAIAFEAIGPDGSAVLSAGRLTR
jgi:acyl dehydratase